MCVDYEPHKQGTALVLPSFLVSAAGKLLRCCVTALSSRTLVNSSVLLMAGRKMEFSCFPAVCQPDRPVRRDFSSSLSSLTFAMSPQGSSLKHTANVFTSWPSSFPFAFLNFTAEHATDLPLKLFGKSFILILFYFFVTVLSFCERSLSSYFHYTI